MILNSKKKTDSQKDYCQFLTFISNNLNNTNNAFTFLLALLSASILY